MSHGSEREADRGSLARWPRSRRRPRLPPDDADAAHRLWSLCAQRLAPGAGSRRRTESLCPPPPLLSSHGLTPSARLFPPRSSSATRTSPSSTSVRPTRAIQTARSSTRSSPTSRSCANPRYVSPVPATQACFLLPLLTLKAGSSGRLGVDRRRRGRQRQLCQQRVPPGGDGRRRLCRPDG